MEVTFFLSSSQKCHLKKPDDFTVNGLRHYWATVSQKNSDMKKHMPKFLGHTNLTHSKFYEMPLADIHLNVVGPLIRQQCLPSNSTTTNEDVANLFLPSTSTAIQEHTFVALPSKVKCQTSSTTRRSKRITAYNIPTANDDDDDCDDHDDEYNDYTLDEDLCFPLTSTGIREHELKNKGKKKTP